MKILALDIGDVWTGTAISDSLGIFARPYQTITFEQLIPFLTNLIAQEPISTIVVGHPQTMRGTKSEQTKKVETLFTELQQKFSTISWVLWDERLSSKQASSLKKSHTKQDKINAHSVAAAFILSGYLDYRHTQRIKHDNLPEN